jgi:glycosyltransferase involved in cell wall biosynthesis
MDLLVSAVVCTHNRATYLRRALASLAAQTLPADRYEIVVVDNASTDATRNLVTREFAGITGLRYVFEPVLGVSRARNAGWRAARAPLVAYLDDDAIAAPDWLARATSAFARLKPAPGCLGGPVLPIWEVPRPAWLPDALLPYLTVLELGQDSGPMPRGKFLYGTNSVFPRELLAEIGGYPPELGPIGRWHRSGEDTFVQKLVRERGHPLWYDPALRVQHFAPAGACAGAGCCGASTWRAVARAPACWHSPPGQSRDPADRCRPEEALQLPRRLFALVCRRRHPSASLAARRAAAGSAT